jgi:hypothetical protein
VFVASLARALLGSSVENTVTVDVRQDFFVRFTQGHSSISLWARRALMHRPSAQEFLQALLETLDDLPPDFARRFEEILKKDDVDRSQAIRQLFEDFAGE